MAKNCKYTTFVDEENKYKKKYNEFAEHSVSKQNNKKISYPTLFISI